MGDFEDFSGKSDKIDGNWMWQRRLVQKLEMTK